ncbi:putative methyltransferase-domain-containing protein [Polychytrium aggregatum]|uniref:putative methyltransferase-domain-containing protein n=1 Tax=Polychytrium aggregatum TaxID=110093 RepID=UPI0022FDBC75|nr:putative methyltransferase-domain-containing protein [Polychytrium aggregatum]KAI9199736.1 putative methyltransferase-domain-containing protein [Polychytrium aggregatum]
MRRCCCEFCPLPPSRQSGACIQHHPRLPTPPKTSQDQAQLMATGHVPSSSDIRTDDDIRTNDDIRTDDDTAYLYAFADDSIPPLKVHQDPSGSKWSAGIGATVWDSALVAVNYFERLASEGRLPPCHRIVEIGAGTGLLGLALATVIAHSPASAPLDDSTRSHPPSQRQLVLTDKAGTIPLLNHNLTLALARDSALAKVFRISTEVLEWSDPSVSDGPVARLAPDLVLIADCVHWPELFTPLIATLEAISSHETLIVLAYERRNFDVEVEFFAQLGKKFSFAHVPEDSQGYDYRSEDIYLFTCRKRI